MGAMMHSISLPVLAILILAANRTDAVNVATKDSQVSLNRYDRFIYNSVNLQNEVDGSVSGDLEIRQRRQVVSRSHTPINVKLYPYSSSCVQLSWDAPPSPSSSFELSGYQYSCNSTALWVNVSLNIHSVIVCGFLPYEYVPCLLRTSTVDDGPSGYRSTSVRTDCAAPDKPQNLDYSNYSTSDSGRERWRFTITWQPPTINCLNISTYTLWYEIPNQDRTCSYTNNTYFRYIYTDGLEQIQVVVAARNNAGLTSSDATLQLTSHALRPQLYPRSVQLVSVSSSCVNMGWQPPEWPNSPITGYEYKCTGAASWTRVANITSSRICGFSPYQEVQCDIRANNSAGVSDVSSSNDLRTDCSAPSKPVLRISDSVTTASDGKDKVTALVTWQPVVPNCRQVMYYNVSLGTIHQIVVPSGNLKLQANDLEPHQNYPIYVEAVNDGNLVSTTESIRKTRGTRPAAPSFDLMFNTSCVSLNISAPEYPYNVVTDYKYNCQQETDEVTFLNATAPASSIDQGELQTLCGLLSAAKVSCDVSAVNTFGESLSVQMSGYTEIAIVVENQELAKYVTSEVIKCEVRVSLQKMQLTNQAALVSKYRVIASLPDTNQLTKRSTSNVLDECNTTQLLDYAAATDLDLSCYITAEVEGSVVGNDGYTFTLGDSDIYGGFYNAPLVPEEGYTLMVAAVIDVQKDEELVYYLPSTDITSPSSKCSTCSTGCIVGITVSAIIACAAAAVIARLICINRRTSPPPAPETIELQDQPTSASPRGGACNRQSINPADVPRTYAHVYETLVKPNLYVDLNERRTDPASLSGQPEMKIIEQEFETLERTVRAIKFKYSDANSNLNKCKNRFADILPSSAHAVTLGGGGYINAVFVDAFPDSKFVVTQLPLDLTTGNFWKMVLEQNITIVVQLTAQTVEFYPEDDGDELYLDSCEVQKVRQEDNQLMSVIFVHLAGVKAQVTEVLVIRIKDWTDGGARTDRLPKTSSLLYYLDVIEMYRGQGKVCITDGDGCSQSGLFITAYNMISCLKSTQHADVYSTALNARSKRKQFLSSFESYRYLYELLDFYKRKTEHASAS